MATIFGEHVMKRFTAYLDPGAPHRGTTTSLKSGTSWDGPAHVVSSRARCCSCGGVCGERSTGATVVILWFCLPIGVMSTTTSKLFHYAYPFLPPVALAGGLAIAWIAAPLYRVLERPIGAFDLIRRRLLGRISGLPGWQVATTVTGLVTLILSVVTFGFERLSLQVGPIVARNSSVARPAATGVALLLAGAPAALVRAVAVSAMLLLVLPVNAYHRTPCARRSHRRPTAISATVSRQSWPPKWRRASRRQAYGPRSTKCRICPFTTSTDSARGSAGRAVESDRNDAPGGAGALSAGHRVGGALWRGLTLVVQ